jgi:hypothetical protein
MHILDMHLKQDNKMKLQKSPNKTSDNLEFTIDGRTSTKVKDVLTRVRKRSERVKKATAIIDELRSSKRQNKVHQLEHKASRSGRMRKHQLLGEAVDRLLDLGAIDGDKIIQELDSRLINLLERQLFNLSPRGKSRIQTK